jgi:hypothetical protein
VTRLPHVLGAALALAMGVGLAWASRAPMTVHPSAEAMLRLAWSARPERIERCRQQSEEELANIPTHMRQPVACEGVTAEYRLLVRVNGTLVADRLVHGGGLRRDRRLYVFEELPIPAGEAAIDIRLDRIDRDDSRDSEKKDDRGEVPPHLAFAERLMFPPRTVVLVTYDPGQRILTAMTRPGTDGAGAPGR